MVGRPKQHPFVSPLHSLYIPIPTKIDTILIELIFSAHRGNRISIELYRVFMPSIGDSGVKVPLQARSDEPLVKDNCLVCEQAW